MDKLMSKGQLRFIRLSIVRGILACFLAVTVGVARAQDATPTATPDDIPPPAELLDEGADDILNVLLLGSDTTNPSGIGRTDVMVIASVNRTAGTVALLSLPRDLYVYIPGYRMYRLNSAFPYGEADDVPGGGVGLLRETVEYNLGLHIDYSARVNFTGFEDIVDALGSVDVAVDCGIQDWRLRERDLDPNVEENWEMFTLPVGVHSLNGPLALWYARSRRTSSDFDRGRRHQQLLRAIWRRARELSLIDQVNDLWPQIQETVETDLPLDVMLSFAAIGTSIDASRIASYTFRQNIETRSWRSPENSSVQAINHEAVTTVLRQFLRPPTEHQIVVEGARVEIVNASGYRDLAQVAADRLAWEGFVPTIAAPISYRNNTLIYDYTGQTKGSSLGILQAALRLGDGGVLPEPSADRRVDFRVIIGGDYYSCTYNVMPPTEAAE